MEIDSKLLGRPPLFDGSEAAWADWQFQTRAYFETLDSDVSDSLEMCELATGEIPFARLNDPAKAAARKVFYILAQLLKGPALLELRRVERGNGLECWRLLRNRYEKATTSRLAATLQAILRPVTFPTDALGFENALKDWELQVTRWESMASEKLNDSVKRQILQEQAPSAIKMQLLTQTFTDYEDMRGVVLSYVVTSRDWTATLKAQRGRGDAMDVDAITFKGGKPKGEAKGYSKGKGKDKGKAAEKEQRDCWICGKKGHLSKDCWHNKDEKDTKGYAKGKGHGKGKHKHKSVSEVSSGEAAPQAPSASSLGPSASRAGATASPPGLAGIHEVTYHGFAEPWDDPGAWILTVSRPLRDIELLYEEDWALAAATFEKGLPFRTDARSALAAADFVLAQEKVRLDGKSGLPLCPTARGLDGPPGTAPGAAWRPDFQLEVNSLSTGEETLLMIDSGAACHVCPKDWMAPAGHLKETGMVSRTASGARMKHFGRRTVRMMISGARGEGLASFEVTEVTRPILSAGRLTDTGHQLVLRTADPHLLRQDGVKIKIEMLAGLPYIRVHALGAEDADSRTHGQWVAPMDEPMLEAPPAGQEPVEVPLAAPRPEALQHDDVQPGVVPTRGLKVPVMPTPAEVAEHELTHMPAKPWRFNET